VGGALGAAAAVTVATAATVAAIAYMALANSASPAMTAGTGLETGPEFGGQISPIHQTAGTSGVNLMYEQL